MVRPVSGLGPVRPASGQSAQTRPAPAARESFASVLARQTGSAGKVRFSAHAQQRLESRGIALDESALAQLNEAVAEAAAKGSRESLVVMEQASLVVNVPNRTVVTAVPAGESGHRVFTNIDSAVVVSAAQED